MNIEDMNQKIKVPKEPIVTIFTLQKDLMIEYDRIERINGFFVPTPPHNLDNIKVQARIKDMFWRTTEELAEALEVVPPYFQLFQWKEFWNTEVSVRHFFEELADALHFLVEASIIGGLEPRTEVTPLFDLSASLDVSDHLNVEKLVGKIILDMGLAANTLKNKPWKQTQMSTDIQKFRNKLIITWRSFMILWQELGCTQKDIYVLYVKKHDVNVWRQNTNY